MEHKPIYLDGVDISKCKFYRPGSFPTDCEINPVNAYCESPTSSNCYFKQLARKTKECEELKREVELMMDCPDCKVDKYKEALEEIEEECNYAPMCGTEFSQRVLDIINKVKDGNNE